LYKILKLLWMALPPGFTPPPPPPPPPPPLVKFALFEAFVERNPAYFLPFLSTPGQSLFFFPSVSRSISDENGPLGSLLPLRPPFPPFPIWSFLPPARGISPIGCDATKLLSRYFRGCYSHCFSPACCAFLSLFLVEK